jgi:hypothetical protein
MQYEDQQDVNAQLITYEAQWLKLREQVETAPERLKPAYETARGHLREQMAAFVSDQSVSVVMNTMQDRLSQEVEEILDLASQGLFTDEEATKHISLLMEHEDYRALRIYNGLGKVTARAAGVTPVAVSENSTSVAALKDAPVKQSTTKRPGPPVTPPKKHTVTILEEEITVIDTIVTSVTEVDIQPTTDNSSEDVSQLTAQAESDVLQDKTTESTISDISPESEPAPKLQLFSITDESIILAHEMGEIVYKDTIYGKNKDRRIKFLKGIQNVIGTKETYCPYELWTAMFPDEKFDKKVLQTMRNWSESWANAGAESILLHNNLRSPLASKYTINPRITIETMDERFDGQIIRVPIDSNEIPDVIGGVTSTVIIPEIKPASKSLEKTADWVISLRHSVGELINSMEKAGLMKEEPVPARRISVLGKDISNRFCSARSLQLAVEAGLIKIGKIDSTDIFDVLLSPPQVIAAHLLGSQKRHLGKNAPYQKEANAVIVKSVHSYFEERRRQSTSASN